MSSYGRPKFDLKGQIMLLSNGLGPRAGQKWTFPKHVLFMTSSSEKPSPKPKIVFIDFDYKTCWIRRGSEQLSSSIAWRVIGLQILQEKWRKRDLKKIFPEHQKIDFSCVRRFPFELHVLFVAGRRVQKRHVNNSRRSIVRRWHTNTIQQRDTARNCTKRGRNFWATAGGSSIGPWAEC